MRRRLAVITEIIAPYRIPVFNALAKEPDIELKVIFLAENDPGLRKWLVYKNEMEFPYQVLSSRRMRLAGRSLILHWGLTTALGEFAPEAIICGGYNDVADWQAWLWARRRKLPFLVWVESNGSDRRAGIAVFESLKKRFLAGSTGVVVPGRASTTYAASLGVRDDSVFIAPNAVDNELFGKRALQERSQAESQRLALGLPERYFLFVGRLIREKGVFDLIEAYAGLSPDIRKKIGLVLVGDGRERAELEKAARVVSPGKIIFRGFVQRDRLVTDYALAEVFVFPTHSDAWGLSVNEAMACGLPVIVADVAGCAGDLVEDGCNGRIVASGNPQQLGRAMAEMAVDAEGRAAMGKRSLEIIANYSAQRCASGLADAARSVWDSHV